MPVVRLDPHAHLYDCYPLKMWVEAAIRNLSAPGDLSGDDTLRAVVVVDRAGQDSFARFRKDVPHFAQWSEVSSEQEGAISGVISHQGLQLLVIRGVQYVTAERLEVLALGAHRLIDDGASFEETMRVVIDSGSLPCVPWSPGKWLGKRGAIIKGLFDRYNASEVVFGDVAIRSTFGPRSTLLARAKGRGFSVVPGSDPLPVRASELELVGSYGVTFSSPLERGLNSSVLGRVFSSSSNFSVWGRPNGPVAAFLRFLATLRSPLLISKEGEPWEPNQP